MEARPTRMALIHRNRRCVKIDVDAVANSAGLQKLLRRFRWRIDITVDQHPSSVGTAGRCEFPSDIVALPRQLSPFRCFGRILLKPKVTFGIDEGAQLGISEVLLPRPHVFQLGHPFMVRR